MLEVQAEQYIALRNALSEIKDDRSAVVSVLLSQSDNGAAFIAASYAELRRLLAHGRLNEADTVGSIIGAVLDAQEGGLDDELAENRIHRDALKWLLDGIGAILGRDNVTGIALLENLTGALYCNESLQWVAWIWIARGAANAGDLDMALSAAHDACIISEKLDGEAASSALCTLGEIELLRKEYDKALENLRAATTAFEQLGELRGLATAWLGRARTHVAAGAHAEGLEAARRAATIDPDWDAPIIFLARRALIAHDADGAAQVLEAWTKAEPRSADVERVLYLLGAMREERLPAEAIARYLELGAELPTAEVADELRTLVDRNVGFHHARELLGWTLVKLNRDDEARKEFEHLGERDLEGHLQASVLLGLGCLANRRNIHRQPGARVRAASSAKEVRHASQPPPRDPVIAPAIADAAPDQIDFDLSLEGDFAVAPQTVMDAPAVGAVPVPAKPASPPTIRRRRANPSGDMQAVDTSAPRAVFTGNLQLFAVPDLLEFLKSSRRTGTLVVTSEHGIGAVHMRGGNITGAAAPSGANIGDVLREDGTISDEQLEKARQLQEHESPNRLIGELLVKSGVDVAKVKSALVKQVHAAISVLVGWTVGCFAFEPDKSGRQSSENGDIDIELDTQGVLLDVLRMIDEANRDA